MSAPAKKSPLAREVERRRTFAIISHPDAGKTTLTEKLLLYGGAIRAAGSVKARRAARHATSDWMELEKQRGISVTSSVMQFGYEGHCVNILDTPGHQDFSEDTYRTLAAADAAVMLIDAAKGVEAQTEKLFRVCRMRDLPIFTFVNKMDRYGRPALDLMDELENHLGMPACPMNWPVFDGADFIGVYDRASEHVHLFEAEKHGETAIEATSGPLDHPEVAARMTDRAREQLAEDLELLDVAGDDLDTKRVLEGELSPMFFGSALNNFGVQLFLDTFLDLAPPPGEHVTPKGTVAATDKEFSGFVFKIQANMNSAHRDRIAFFRVCSGRFSAGMDAWHPRLQRKLRLKNPAAFMARERSTIDEAYAGDIVGLYDPGIFRIGDALSNGSDVAFGGIPSFSPEIFRRVRIREALKRKQLDKGLSQLAEEGAIQIFRDWITGAADIVGAVGALQLDVLIHRLESEYNVKASLDPMPFTLCRWVIGRDFDHRAFKRSPDSALARDRDDRPVILFASEWAANWAHDNNEGFDLRPVSPLAEHAGDI